jgi:hypothetical protein
MKSIDKIEGVIDVDWELNTSGLASAQASPTVNPGERYYVAVKYLQEKKNGKAVWKKLNNTEGITLSVDNPAFSGAMPWFEAPLDPFVIFQTPQAKVTVHIPGSSGKDITKVVQLSLPSSLPSFRGKDGSAGSSDSMVNFHSSSASDGANGTDGQNVDLEIAHYNVKGTTLERLNPLLLVRDSVSGRVWLLAAGTSLIAIDASGGSGGNGAKGEDRTLPDDSDEKSIRGEAGGDGGSGGKGGTVHVVMPKDSGIVKSLTVTVSGGKGGKGGEGGKGETRDDVDNFIDFLGAVVGVTDGRDGSDGRNGSDGRYVSEFRELSALFTGISSPLFDRSRLEP